MNLQSSETMERAVVCIVLLCFLVVDLGVEVAANSQNLNNLQSIPSDQLYRTAFHFQPPRNWMNDPNGPMYYNGVYHLFYQHNPSGPLFSDNFMVWAHSVSYDLINWIPLETALYPSEPFDICSCWSGSVTILPGNKPVILYTGINSEKTQVQNLAVPKNLSDPFLREWVKYSGNPIINLPEGIDRDQFRDPSTALLGPDGKWRIVIGSVKNEEGIAFLYQSEDFFNWSKVDHPIFALKGTGVWECPDFYPVSVDSKNGLDTSVVHPDVKYVIKVGLWTIWQDYYIVGSYAPEKENYIPQNGLTGSTLNLRYDYGKFYASKSFFDSGKNRRVLWGWVNESDATEDDVKRGWSGLQAIPRSVWLDRNGKQLVQWPVEEIEALHDNEVTISGKKLECGSLFEVEDITAAQADVKISFKLTNLEDAEVFDPSWTDPQSICSAKDASTSGKFGPFGLLALASTDLTEQTAIFFRIFKDHERYVVLMCSDQSRSSLSNTVDKTTYGAFVDIDPRHEEISLRTLVDHSIIESFGGEGRTCITARVYPKLAIDKEARVFAFNYGTENVVISKLHAWSMKKAQVNAEEDLRCTD